MREFPGDIDGDAGVHGVQAVTVTTPRVVVLTAAVLTTVASAYPAFVTGALGPELRPDLAMSDVFFGFAVGGFFLGGAIGSAALGHLGERVGPRRMLTAALATTAVAALAIAIGARNGWHLAGGLALAGLANAASQTSVNQLLSRDTDPRRLGFAMALKQSGMPGATLLGGLAVPAIALTVGWRWSYVASALLAMTALAMVRRGAPETARRDARRAGRLHTPMAVLCWAAIGGGFASAAAGTLGNWLTSSAVDIGWSSGSAGLLLALGSVAGITVRLILGAAADHRRGPAPMTIAAVSLAIGALGAVALAPRASGGHLVGAIVAFGAGWAWPAVFNYAIVRANPDAPARSTGITQTGVYAGVLIGPAAMGIVVDRVGYAVGWFGVGAAMAVGAVIMRSVSARIDPVELPPRVRPDRRGDRRPRADQSAPGRRSDSASGSPR
ncbi:MAG: MFS transporter [Desertimonas sp.]